MKTFLFFIGGLWLLAILGFIIYGHVHHEPRIAASTQNQVVPVATESYSDAQEPVTGDEISNPEEAKDVVIRYLQYLNQNDMEMASTLWEPNTFVSLLQKQNGGSPKEAMSNVMTLFPPKTAKSFQVIKETKSGSIQIDIQIRIFYKDGKKGDFSFFMKQLQMEGDGQSLPYWFILGVTKA